MRGVDEVRDPLFAQIARQALRAAEAAGAHLALGQARFARAARERGDEVDAILRRQLLGELKGFVRAAEDQDAHVS